MIPLYEEKKENICLIHRVSKHVPPHLHSAIEFVYVTAGTLEIGVAQELFHMERGDLALVFPDVVHHYQVFSSETSKAVYMRALPSLSGPFREDMQKYCPKDPVIKADKVHTDISNAFRCLMKDKESDPIVEQSYIQIILARSMPLLKLVEKSTIGGDDIVYQIVSYIAGHFKEELSLEKMAKDLGVSKYVLSRVFSSTFHRNFNQYLNEQRLNYVGTMLEGTDKSITDICMDAGFQSYRTFNRAFQEKFRMTPREYRNSCKEKYFIQ